MKPAIVVKTATSPQVRPPANPAVMRVRHHLAWLSFVAIVALPSILTAWYLWTRAADQYASHLGFSVRKEESGSAFDSILGIAQLSGSSSSDTDVLNEYLQSQDIVEAVDKEIDLSAVWSRPAASDDFVFAYSPTGTIEDLLAHWQRMVRVHHDTSTGLIEVRVLSFDPVDSWAINELIFKNSSLLINKLSSIAREDAVDYARDELSLAEKRLGQARIAIAAYRNETQVIDPVLHTQTQSGLVAALESQLAEAQIDRSLLSQTTRSEDPRIARADRQIAVIKDQIAKERAKLGLSDARSGRSVANLVADFEALNVELEFAQQAYLAAQVSLDTARNEALRKSRYLAAHVSPTLAEKAEYPQRTILFCLTSLFLFLGWSVAILIFYALRDRR